MFIPIDIFEQEADGSVVWRGAAENFEAAQERVQILMKSVPGEYFIFNQTNERRILLTPKTRVDLERKSSGETAPL